MEQKKKKQVNENLFLRKLAFRLSVFVCMCVCEKERERKREREREREEETVNCSYERQASSLGKSICSDAFHVSLALQH